MQCYGSVVPFACDYLHHALPFTSGGPLWVVQLCSIVTVLCVAVTLSLLQPDNRNPRPENVEGSFFVDHTCIDCDTCRIMAPDTFSRIGVQSAVHQQPTDTAGRVAALQALFSCPTCVTQQRCLPALATAAACVGIMRQSAGRCAAAVSSASGLTCSPE
jgi:ferredoxin